MPEVIKRIALTLAILGTFVGGAFVLENELDVMSYEEYQAVTAIYDYEIKEAGGITLIEVRNRRDAIDKLHTIIRAREETGEVEINGETLNAEEYILLRDTLLNKAE